jgi:hypothetical protein
MAGEWPQCGEEGVETIADGPGVRHGDTEQQRFPK